MRERGSERLRRGSMERKKKIIKEGRRGGSRNERGKEEDRE